MRFHHTASGLLSREIAGLIVKHAPPRVTVKGSKRLHVGMYRKDGKRYLHIHNFIAYSESSRFIKPFYLPPDPARDVTVRLRGLDVSAARYALHPKMPAVPLRRSGADVLLTIPSILWSEVIELD